MFKFRNANIALILCSAALGIMGANWYFLIILIFIYFSILVLGVSFIGFNFFVSSVNNIPNKRNQIAITFDDGPTPETLEVLKILSKWKAKATFFCIGTQVEKHPDILKQIVEQGHLVGNHTYSHQHTFPVFSQSKMLEDVEKASREIAKITGEKPSYFRPPFGVTNPRIAKMLKQTKLISIGWNKRSLDTSIKDKSRILERITSNLKSGDIILLHDRMPNSANLLNSFFEQTANMGFEFARVDKMMNTDLTDFGISQTSRHS
jgi:peptidoglycan/xylan/chitin deacetylase (PgdA/CDA1 family)